MHPSERNWHCLMGLWLLADALICQNRNNFLLSNWGGFLFDQPDMLRINEHSLENVRVDMPLFLFQNPALKDGCLIYKYCPSWIQGRIKRVDDKLWRQIPGISFLAVRAFLVRQLVFLHRQGFDGGFVGASF